MRCDIHTTARLPRNDIVVHPVVVFLDDFDCRLPATSARLTPLRLRCALRRTDFEMVFMLNLTVHAFCVTWLPLRTPSRSPYTRFPGSFAFKASLTRAVLVQLSLVTDKSGLFLPCSPNLRFQALILSCGYARCIPLNFCARLPLNSPLITLLSLPGNHHFDLKHVLTTLFLGPQPMS